MPDNIGDAVGRIIIDTSSVDNAVRRMQDASSRISRLMRDISANVERASDGALGGSTKLIKAQADAMRAHAQDTIAQARLVTAQTKAESEKRIAQARAEAQAIQAETRRQREATKNAASGGHAGREGRASIRVVQEQLREAEMRLRAQTQRFNQMGGTKEQRSDVQKLIDEYSNDIKDAKIRLQELKKEFADFLRNPGGSVSPQKQINRLNDITASFSGGVGWEVTPQVSKFGREQEIREAMASEEKRRNDAIAGARKEQAAKQAAAKKDLDDILRLQQETQRLLEAKRKAAAQKLINDEKTSLGGAQSAVNAASARIRAMQEQIRGIQTKAPAGMDMDTLEGEFSAANQKVLEFQATISRLRTDLQDVATTPEQRMAIIQQLQAVRTAALEAGTSGLDPLRAKINNVNADVMKATTGIRGYFNRLRDELEEINRRSLGKNIQELGFRLSPIGLAAGAAFSQGTGVAMELEEANLAFRAMTESEEEANELMGELTESARRFGLPIVETFKSMQRFIPLIRQSGGELDKVIEIAARLQTLNPAQGFEGALFSITEAMASGENGLDAISLRERFGIVPEQLRNAREETGDLVSALDLVLNRMDRTTDLAEQFGQTTRATFTRARDAIEQFLAKAIVPVLNFITPLIEAFNEFVDTLVDMNSPLVQIGGILLAVTAGVVGLTFAVGNLIIAGEAIAGVFAALTGAQVAAGAATAAAGTAATGGLVAGLGALAAALVPILPLIIGVGLAIGAIAIAMSTLSDQATSTRDEALQPLIDKLAEVKTAVDEITNIEIPDIGAEGSEFNDVQSQIDEIFTNLPGTIMETVAQLGTLVEQQKDDLKNQLNSQIEGTGSPDIVAANLGQAFIDLDIPTIIRQEILTDLKTNGIFTDEMLDFFSVEELAYIADTTLGATNTVGAALRNIESAMSEVAERFAEIPGILNSTEVVNGNRKFLSFIQNLVDDFGKAPEAFAGTDKEDGLVQKIRDAQERYQELMDSFTLDNSRTFQDRGLDASREIEDFLRGRQRAVDDYNQELAEADDDYYKDRQRMIDDYNNRLEDEDTETADKRLKQEQDYNKQVQRAYEDHVTEMRRMARDVDDAISARDFLAAQKALEKMNDAEEDYQTEARRRAEDYAAQQAELDDNIKKQKKKRDDDFAQQLKDYDDNYAQQRAKRIAAFQQQIAREDEDRRIRLARQLQDYAIMDQRRAEDFNRQLEKLNMHNELMAFYTEYGYNVLEQKALEWANGLIGMQVIQPTSQAGYKGTTPYGGVGTVTDILGPAFPTGTQGGNYTSNSFTRGSGGGRYGFGQFADGIWNLPIDAIARVHKGEMIVPQPMAAAVRRGEVALGSGGSGGTNITRVYAPQISVKVGDNTNMNEETLIRILKEQIVQEMIDSLESQPETGFEFNRGRNV